MPNRFATSVAGSTPRQGVLIARRSPDLGALTTRAVGSYIPRLTRKAFEKYGFSAATLLTDWAGIVGADLARYTEPERLKWPTSVAIYEETDGQARGRPGATLVLRVDPARALEVQYKSQHIIDRINAYFGYAAVAALRMLQAPPRQLVESRPTASVARNLPVNAELETIPDAALRDALQRMAHAIVMRKSP